MGALLEQLRAGRAARISPVSLATQDVETPTPPTPGPLLQALRASRPRLQAAPPLSLRQRIGRFLQAPLQAPPEESIARAQNLLSLSRLTGLRPSEVERHFETLRRQPSIMGIRTEPSAEEFIGLPITAGLTAGAIANPAIIPGLFAGTVAATAARPITRAIKRAVLPPTPSETATATLDALETIGQAVLFGKVAKATPGAIHALTKRAVTTYKLPRTVQVDAAKVRSIFQTGKAISPAESELVRSLGLTGPQYRVAVQRGVTIAIPTERVIQITDRPWWAVLKQAIRLPPSGPVTTIQRAGVPQQVPAGTLPAPSQVPPAPAGPLLTALRATRAAMIMPPTPPVPSAVIAPPNQGELEAIHQRMNDIEQEIPTLIHQRGQGDRIRLLKQEFDRLEERSLAIAIQESPKAQEPGLPLPTLAPFAPGVTYPLPKPHVKIVKALVELLPDDVEASKAAVMATEAGQAGRRTRTETGDWIGIPSSFPDYFKNKGYTKKESLAILNNVLEGKPVTEKQKAIALDIIAGSRAHLAAEKEAFDAALTSESEQARLEGHPSESIAAHQRAGEAEAEGRVTAEGLGEPALEEGPLPPEATEFAPAKLEAEVQPVQQQLPGTEPKLPPGGVQPPTLFQEKALGPLFEQPQRGGGGGGATAGAPREYKGEPLPAELSQESTSVGEPVFGGMHFIKPLQMPEIVRLVRELSGNVPRFSTRLTVHRGLFYSNRGLIKLHPTIFKNPDVAAKVLTHEIGHLIDWLPTQSLKRGNLIGRALSMTYKFMTNQFQGLSNPVFKKELSALTHFWHPFDATAVPKSYLSYRQSPRELYAEFVSVLLNSPVKAKELAPTFYETFFKFLSRKPEVAEEFFALQDLTTGLEEDLLRARENDIKQMFQNAEQVFAQKRLQSDQAKKSLWFKLKYELIDKNIAILEKRNVIADKRKIPPESDPAFLVEELSYISSVVKSHLEGFDPIYQKLQTSGLDFAMDFGQYLFLKRVWGERTQIANPLGQIPATAARQLEFMRQRLGEEKWKQLESLVGETRDWFKGINKLMEEDLLTPEQIALINANTVYAPFQVIQYLQEYVSAGIIHQVGTLGEIANPAVSMFLKAISMIRAAERNRIQKGIGQFMLQHFAGEATPARVIQIPGTPPRIQERAGFGIVKWKEKGKWQAAYVDPFIADSFSSDSEGSLQLIGDVLSKITLNQPVFRPLFITFNLGFQSYNLIRDFLRFWKNIPGMTMPRAVRLYAQSLGPALRRIKGIRDPLIQQMERESAVNITYNDYLIGETNEEEEIRVLMRRFGILPANKKVFPLFRPIVAVLDAIKFSGDVIETVPKVAGFKALRDLSAKERASMVRNFIGTPNWKRRGRAYAIYNNVFLFSNIIKEGYRGDYEAAFRNPSTRAGFWWKAIKINLLPKIAMWLAALGFFGKAVKDGMDAATEYDKTNYTVIPVGEDGHGETMYLRIPHDETGRFLSGLLWKSLNGAENGVTQSATDLFSLTGGQLPSLSPIFELASNWYQFLTGRNPRDEFRGREILTDDEVKAGGLYALEPMVRWTINQFGQVHLAMRDRVSDETLLDRALQLTPIVNRWIRTSSYGVTERLRKQAIEPIQRQEARERLQRNRGIVEAIRQGYPLTDALRGLQGRKRSIAERKFRRTQARAGGDPVASALLQATTNAQKLAVLQRASAQFATPAAFQRFLQQMVRQKVISFEVAQHAHRSRRRP